LGETFQGAKSREKGEDAVLSLSKKKGKRNQLLQIAGRGKDEQIGKRNRGLIHRGRGALLNTHSGKTQAQMKDSRKGNESSFPDTQKNKNSLPGQKKKEPYLLHGERGLKYTMGKEKKERTLLTLHSLRKKGRGEKTFRLPKVAGGKVRSKKEKKEKVTNPLHLTHPERRKKEKGRGPDLPTNRNHHLQKREVKKELLAEKKRNKYNLNHHLKKETIKNRLTKGREGPPYPSQGKGKSRYLLYARTVAEKGREIR